MSYQIAPGSRAAASLLLLRDDSALEVLMLRRPERAGELASGAAVFPGGVLDARDREAHAFCAGEPDAAWSARLGLAEGGLDYAVAALRESFEEVGLLLADRGFDAAAARPWRETLQRGEAGAADLCRALGLNFDLRGLAYYSHWLTPPGLPKRFDTRFFAALAPQGQQAEADNGEAVELMWLAPQAALDPARGLKLLPVTRRTLQELVRFGRAADAWGAAEERQHAGTIRITMPRRAQSARGLRIVLPDELPYAEIARLDPDGRADAHADLVAGRAVRLSPRVVRVTAPNPGMMTGPGTNSYLVGEGDRWAVIDPGPDDASHRAALLAAAPGRIERVLVTHTHVDHSPGAAALSAATGAVIEGRRPAFAAGQDPDFAPAREPAHGERLVLGPSTTLRVIHTPGHASNHLCYLLEEEKLLFTGDHVMQGSTVVINPPDGDMAAYLRALEALLEEDIEWFAPGHGFLVAQPHEVLRALIRHRLKRESKVAAALKAAGRGTLDALLPRVYDDVPPALYPMARRSLLAHLIKLRGDGVAAAAGDEGEWSYLG